MNHLSLCLLPLVTICLANGQLANNGKVPDCHPVCRKITRDLIRIDIDATELAGLYQKFSGQRVIVDEKAKGSKATVVIEASPDQPVEYKEVTELIRKATILEALAFVEDPTDPLTCILKPVETRIRGYVPPPPIYSETTPLPQGDEVVSYVMTLKHIKPDAAVKLLIERRGETTDFQSICAIPHAAAVLIHDKTSSIRKMIEHQKEFDQPPKEGK